MQTSDAKGSVSVCRTVLVLDEPETGADDFGPHERIADAIAALIVEEEKSVAVGVEGAWGSGKTTVVNLLRAALKGRAEHRARDYAVVTFDAWAHEGDPLRRTFLETFVGQLQEKQADAGDDGQWVKTEEWELRLDEIANRRSVQENKNIPTLGPWDKALIASLAVVPLGTALFGAALREEWTVRLGMPAWKFLFEAIAGLILSLAPFAVYLWRLYWKKQSWNDTNIWTLLTSKGVSESRTETLKTPEPTSVEFEKAFLDLTEQALRNNPARKIVLVIDNLDRVDSKDALTIWSTLQTFLQHKPNQRYEWLNRLWTVVLYDPRGLSALWSDAGADAATSDLVCRSFVAKTFQIRFEVPEPVLSEWRDFLVKKLADAFPDHAADWHTVSRVRALHAESRRPTARELKLFVNQIGALHRQWARGPGREADEYPLAHIACFVIHREAPGNLLEHLLSGRVPHQNDKNLLGPDLSRSLAGLAFNIERERGYQMLLSGPIRSALNDGESQKLKEWAEKNDGFWEVLEDTITRDWFGDNPLLLANAANVLEESGLLDTPDRREVASVVESLCQGAERVGQWPFDENGRAGGLATLCRWKAQRAGADETARFVKTILKSMTAWLLLPRESGEVHLPKWLELTRLIVSESSLGDAAPLYTEGVVAPIGELHGRPGFLDGRQIIHSVDVLLQLTEQNQPLGSAVEQLQSLAGSEHFRKLLQKSQRHGVLTQATCLLTILAYRPGGVRGVEGVEPLANTEVSHLLGDPPIDFAGAFTDLLARHRRFGLLFDILDNLPRAGVFVVSCLRYIAEEKIEYAGALFTPELFVSRYRFVSRLLHTEESQSELTDRLISHLKTPLLEYVVGRRMDEGAGRLYLDLYRLTADERLKEWCYRELRSVRRAEWEKTLSEEGERFFLVSKLDPPDEGKGLGEDFAGALLTCARRMIAGKLVPKYPDYWRNLPAALNGEGRELLRRHLLAELKFSDGNASEKFFDAFGSEVAAPGLWEGEPRPLSGFFLPALTLKNMRAVRWLSDILPHLDVNEVAKQEWQAFAQIRGMADNVLGNEFILPDDPRVAAAKAFGDAWREFVRKADASKGLLIQGPA